MSILAGVFAALLLSGAPQAAQTSPSPQAQDPATDGATRVDDVEVTARPLNEQVGAFVADVAAPPKGRNLARWDRKICIGVANFDPRYAQVMIDRVAATAAGLGLEPAAPGCKADVMIVASADPDTTARRIIEDDPYGFHPAQSGTDLGRDALRRFQESDAPVRWWQVSMPVSSDTGEVAIRLIDEEPPTVVGRLGSRLRANVRDDLARVLIIIDTARMGEVSFSALADYVTMITLAQIDPEADASEFPSVLNLFDRTRGVTGFTDWDRDYLRGLYGAERDLANPSQQARNVVREVVGASGERQQAAESGANRD